MKYFEIQRGLACHSQEHKYKDLFNSLHNFTCILQFHNENATKIDVTLFSTSGNFQIGEGPAGHMHIQKINSF